MGLLDNYTGIGMSPRPKWEHQNVMDTWLFFTHKELRKQGLHILTEATVTEDCDDLAPDLVIFDEHNYPLSIIEITTHKECGKIIKKCYELIDRFPDSEYFVYDYERLILYKYDYERDDWHSSEEDILYSRYLTYPLLDYLHME